MSVGVAQSNGSIDGGQLFPEMAAGRKDIGYYLLKEAPNMPPPGPNFYAAARSLAGQEATEEEVTPWVDYYYYSALYRPRFQLQVDYKTSSALVSFLPGHIWNAVEAGNPNYGPSPAPVMIIGKMPGREEAQHSENLIGPAGKLLKDLLVELDEEEDYDLLGNPENDWANWYTTNLLKFYSADLRSGTIPTNWLKDCMPLLHQEFRLVRPKYILCLGVEAMKAVLGKSASLSNTCGQSFDLEIPIHDSYKSDPQIHVAKVMACIHPAAVVRTPDLCPQLKETLRLFRYMLSGGVVGARETDLEHIVVSNETELSSVVDKILSQHPNAPIAIDCEWEGDHPGEPGAYLRTVQFSHRAKFACCVVLRKEGGDEVFKPGITSAVEQLKRLLKSTPERKVRIVAHFGRADIPWLLHLGIDIRPEFDAPLDDPETMSDRKMGWEKTKNEGGADVGLMAHSHSEAGTDYKLEILASRHLGTPRYDFELQNYKKAYLAEHKIGADDLTGYGFLPSEILHPYACLNGQSLVQIEDGSWVYIKKLVDSKYSGRVKAFMAGKVVNAKVVNWHKHYARQKEWYKLQTSGMISYPDREPSGPIFTPDHKILTNRGLVRVDQIDAGNDKILTEEREFSAEQLSVFLGSILGDGGFHSLSTKGRFWFSQALIRAGYADWKASVFSNYSPRRSAVEKSRAYVLPASRYLQQLYQRFPVHSLAEHGKRKAIITQDLLDNLGDLGLAIWYQDDGNLNHCGTPDSKYYSSRIYCRINKKEQELVLAWLTAKFGPGVSYVRRFIQLSKSAFQAFHEAINPYMHPAVAYKTPLPVEGEYTPCKDGVPFYNIISAVLPYKLPRKRAGNGVRYCLTVEGAGNFLTKAGFVSNCYDVDSTRRLFDIYNGIDGKPGLLDKDRYGNNSRRAYWTSQRAQLAFLEMELSGVLLDRERAETLTRDYRDANARLIQHLREQIKWPDFNPDSDPQRRELLFGERYNLKFDPKTGLPVRLRPTDAICLDLEPVASAGKRKKPWASIVMSGESRSVKPNCDKETLGILAAHCKEAKMLRDTRFIAQTLKSVLRRPKTDENGQDEVGEDGRLVFEKGFIAVAHSDNRIRTHFFQTKETGRASSSRPPLQNLSSRREADYKRILGPAHYKYPIRSILRASPGKVLIEADYSGAEVYGMAIMSGDEQMLDHARRSCLPDDHPDYYDVHSNVAVQAFRLDCEPTKAGLKSIDMGHLRVAAKAVFFGYAYGQGPEASARKAREEGADVTTAEAITVTNGLREMYPLLDPFFAQCRFRVKYPGWMCNCFGRYRRFRASEDRQVMGELERQAMNFPIQSMIADAVSRAMDHLYNYRFSHPEVDYTMLLQIHDAVILEADYKYVPAIVDQILPECMIHKVPIFRSDLDGRFTGEGPYYLGIGTSVSENWGVKLKADRALELGIDPRYVEE